ncbi:dolichol-phosphate mannosyltransferase [Mucilaginibacter pineti]|uniref:Dolichol-phosphate mannosyltransferase n=1 Tax=Mucilaginibacter pineti TaxID=1391627 RepID=A0A1G6U3J4_9SPHI|nr:glycosyltransferase family 2 protein [Mucilaginibacter pineti]SDD35256.1 dolichol-phosphate mannosyltransferase [Mucilaginibacter pineti]
MRKISIVIPAHNEERNISYMVSELQKLFSDINYDYECIFVDDGSTDNTLNEIKIQREMNPHVYFVELSRNFGKDQALQAGIELANGDAVITMDADMQHPPRLIIEMIKLWESDYDVVYTYREKANEHVKSFQKLTSKLFYKGINMLSEIQMENGIADFRLIDKKVVTQLKLINEYDIFFRGMVKWVGFKQIGIPYNPAPRFSGEASYSVYKLFKLGLNSTMSFSVRPLYAATFLGLIFSLASLLYIPYVLISYFFGLIEVSGWASLIATIAFFGGLQLFVLGIIGMYLGKLFMQAKQRPNYIIRTASYINIDNDLIKL